MTIVIILILLTSKMIETNRSEVQIGRIMHVVQSMVYYRAAYKKWNICILPKYLLNCMAFPVYIPKVGSTEDKELTFIAILLILNIFKMSFIICLHLMIKF